MSNFFAPLVGQNQAVELLTQAIIKDRIAPAYLFAGPDGVGRSLAARCFVAQIFCAGMPTERQQKMQHRLLLGNHADLLWVEPTYLHQGQRLSAAEAAAAGLKRKAPPLIRLEQVREIAQFLSRSPLAAPRSMVVIEQAETMAEAAANALLKTLEEPGLATIILIAPSTESLLPTLVSRCQRIPFYRLNLEGMTQILQQTGHAEILQQPSVLAVAQGSPGAAIASWQQLQVIPSNLLQAIVAPPKSLKDVLETARQIDTTLDTAAQLWLVDYLQHHYWQQFSVGQIQRSPIQQLEQARKSLLCFAQPRLVWECTLLAMLH
ncbi:MAG: DNA polymerase III subunit delta' [Chroococcidiopsidaceae cyanobacterium CP_BM_RX_35]|nr:DNA polymerase III subunit delta' [Chroococcidiopsidaceae cyanobacterium CP_BM_RX_35]